jgi:hypothetical protein
MRFLDHMVQRLYAGLATGPAINCRPHRSRQRLDLAQIAACCGTTPAAILEGVLGEDAKVSLDFELGAPPKPAADPTPAAKAALLEYQAREATLRKLSVIADDARTYAQDTGAHALQIGLPILNLPPRDATADRRTIDKRILAPCAFVPVSLVVRSGRRPGIDLACVGDGIDRVIPNEALLAWIGQQIGKKLTIAFSDEEGAAPWRELGELVESIRAAFGLPAIDGLDPTLGFGAGLPWTAVPRTEDATTPAIVPAAVLGLFPLTHQALLDDLEAMAAGEVPLVGPVQRFTQVDVEHPTPPGAGATVVSAARRGGGERLVCTADPCQVRAVDLARTSPALVIHGPPGTGKSQTIANIIADHLARGERVLFICDKRTALDVVHHRLEHLGLGTLCAVVHDAQRDQKELYRDIRDQLDGLGELHGDAKAAAELALRDREIETLHTALAAHTRAVSEPTAVGEPSFHALCGEWIAIAPGHAAAESIEGVDPASMVGAHKHVLEVLTRADDPAVVGSPWRGVAAIGVEAYLAQPAAHWRARLDALVAVAEGVDAIATTAVLPLREDPRALGAARARWAEAWSPWIAAVPWASLVPWIGADAATRARVRAEIDAAAALVAAAAAPMDPQLLASFRTAPWDAAAITSGIAALGEYLAGADRWYAFLRFGANAAVRAVVARLGLALGPEQARVALAFLEQHRAQAAVRALWDDRLGGRACGTADAALGSAIAAVRGVAAAMDALETDPRLASDAATIRAALLDPAGAAPMLDGLLRQEAIGVAIAGLGDAAIATGMLTGDAASGLVAQACARQPTVAHVRAWIDALPTLEGLLRLEAAAAALPAPLRPVVWALAETDLSPEAGWNQVRRGVLAGAMATRLRGDPSLLAFDGDKLRAYHGRWDLLEGERHGLVRDVVLQQWIDRQRGRLLAQTGSRLSSLGAELKRRLALRGERVMRLRQVIATGAATEGGDPIFDLRPVWMASPETAAQIFSRAPAFDVIVFDEASQCRLEHALPVLLRGHRVVIAGDPKQLPPTRFFEGGATLEVEADDTMGELSPDQGLFEAQQAGIEDLLAAALNLEVEQCYLDVHYRSAHADLIGYSNEHFYAGRLQAIPDRPGPRGAIPPVELVQVAGVYADNRNPTEAAKVVEIVRGLLDAEAPPSIGIACFNLTQRELILETLDAAAADDDVFAERLAIARARQGAGSFEGLFVKNLENVQGDERDHIIISTTYGRTAEGKFYRRFGPLGQAGGGRRLNVLITRARKHVHLVTSIPREVYLAEVEVPAGQAPGGGLLLLGYLRWAEALAARYAAGDAVRAERLVVRSSPTASSLARALGERIVRDTPHLVDVHFGNEGFGVDVAVRPAAGGSALGVLCDGSRFDRAVDRVQWDVFRSRILAAQGWPLLRLTSPQVFRDPAAAIGAIAKVTP